MTTPYFVPLRELLTTWDETGVVPESGTNLLNRVAIDDFAIDDAPGGVRLTLALGFQDEIGFEIPGLDGCGLYLGGLGESTTITAEIELSADVRVRLVEPAVRLRVSSDLLAPVTRVDGAFEVDRLPDGRPKPYEVALSGFDVRYDAARGVELASTAGALQLALPPVMIGETGIVLEIDEALLFFSANGERPAGIPQDFRGIAVGMARVTLPPAMSMALPTTISVTGALIGSGGFTGRIAAEWSPTPNATGTAYEGAGAGTLFGIPFGLRRFAVEFRRNSLLASDLRAELVLPFFDQPLGLDLGLGLDGGLTATLSAAQPAGVVRNAAGLIEFERPGLLRLRLDSIGFEAGAGDFLVRLSGTIKLLYGGLDWPEVEVRDLSIDRDGHVRIEGGWLDLPRSASLDFNGFAMELNRIGFGTTGDRKWIGFSGGIRLIDQISFGASVDGLKVLWDADGHVDLQMSAVSVDLTVPDVLSFSGRVEYVEEPAAKGFKGDVSLTLDAIDATFDASLIVGRHTEPPLFNFAYVYVNAQLPAGIPLAQTNLAIYGFAGLLGTNVAPDKPDTIEWFAWYTAPPVGATAASKWHPDYGTQALGAGLTLGTAADNGYAFAAKAILIVLFPGPLLLIDGKANLLEDRSKLDGAGQGQHRALAVIDRRAGTFLVNLQPTFKYDVVTGAVIQITGAAEGFFDYNRPNAWHVYIGEAQPLEKRIRARILKGLLNADAYLMLDRAGMRLGAGASLDREYDFGRFSVGVAARLEGQAEVSWRPIQMDGALTYEAIAELRAFGCSASVSIDTLLEVQSPHPYHVFASFRVRLRTPWPLPDPSARVRMEWGDPDDEPPLEPIVGHMAAEHLKVMDAWELRIAPDLIESAVPTIPLDARILVSFNRPVADEALVGCNPGPPPRPDRVGALEVLHELRAIVLERKSVAGWEVVERRADGEGEMFGAWLPLPEKENSAAKLQLWSASPFTYVRRVGRGYVDRFLEDSPAYPCAAPEPAEPACTRFDDVQRRLLPPLFIAGDLIFEFPFTDKAMQPRILVRDGVRVLVLTFKPDQPAVTLRITPSEPAAMVQVRIGGAPPGVTLTAYGQDAPLDTQHTAAAGEIVLTVKGAAIEHVEVEADLAAAPRELEIREVCVTRQTDHDRAVAVERVRHHLNAQMSADAPPWCGKGHLLEPDTLYRLRVDIAVRRWRDGAELPALPATTAVTHFWTEGPPGAFPTEGPLRDLSPYVDEARSTPAPGMPVFYGAYDLRVVFNENYVERLYDGTGRPIGVALLDRNAAVARDSSGNLVETAPVWDTDPNAEPSRADRLWLWTLQRAAVGGCGPLTGGDCVARPDALIVQLPGRPLAPRQLVEISLSAAGLTPPLHRRSFTTSTFATFSHHVHSFMDAAWDHARLAGLGDDPLVTPEAVGALADVVRAKRDEHPGFDPAWEASAFDDLAAAVFALGLRPLPERMEITELRDAQRSYGLLLESPEPIEWRRVTLDVRHSPAAGVPNRRVRGALKIVGALLPAPGTDSLAAEWIEVMALAETDVSGVAIFHSSSAGGSPPERYYRFGAESPLSPGTIVRVHPAPSATGVATAPECLVRYAEAEEGQPPARLDPAGAVVSLVDPLGVERHSIEVRPAGAYQPLPHVLIRSADQTRAFLFFTMTSDGVGDVPPGVLRLDWTFARDIGAGAPLLTRRGSAVAEAAAIEFRVPAGMPPVA